jgi:hypothetical protein
MVAMMRVVHAVFVEVCVASLCLLWLCLCRYVVSVWLLRGFSRETRAACGAELNNGLLRHHKTIAGNTEFILHGSPFLSFPRNRS